MMHSNNTNKIRHCFNRSASSYDQYSYPQQMIGAKLIDGVYQHIQQAEWIADLGCGTGIMTEQLINKIKFKQLYAFDISEAFIQLAKNRLRCADISIFHDTFDNVCQQNQLFDLVFSNMALHWSDDMAHTLSVINNNMPMQGLIAFTVPLEGTFQELAAASRNPFYSLAKIADYLTDAGFSLLECFEESFVFRFPSWIKAIKSIKATGTNYVFHRENKNLTGTSSCHRHACLNHDRGDTPALTYQIGYLIGRKIRDC